MFSSLGPVIQIVFSLYVIIAMVTNIVCYTAVWIVIKKSRQDLNAHAQEGNPITTNQANHAVCI